MSLDLFHESNLIAWGIVVIIGVPAVVLALSEFIQAARARGIDDYIEPLNFLRNFVVPLAGLAILTQIAEVGSDSIIYRVVQTAFWIAVVNSVLAFTNVFFFADDDDSKMRAKAPKLFLDLLRFLFVMVGAAVVVSQIWDVDLTGLLTALGVGSIVIGLALQDTLGSIFSGIALLSARQFKVGDWIRVDGNEGTVSAMSWRSVTITTRSGDNVVLPNTVLARDRVVNFGVGQGWHSELVSFTFAYDHPPEVVKRVITEAAYATPVILDTPAPDARIKEYGDDGIVYQGRIFLPSYQPTPVTKSDFQCMVWYHAQRAGLKFPAQHHRLQGLPASLKPLDYSSVEDRVSLLAQVEKDFGTLEGLEPYMENARFLRYREGESLLSQGRVSTHAYIVVSGACETLSSVSGALVDKDEEGVVLHEFTEGQAILFKSLFRGEPTAYEVRAKTDLAVLAIPRDVFEQYLSSHPDLARKVEQILSARDDAANRLLKRLHPDRVVEGTIREQRIKMLQDMFSE